MCICEFCNTSFLPRPQTKNPRACNNPKCQKVRQAANERDWHKKHQDLYRRSAKYHQDQRKRRNYFFSETINNLLDAIFSGFRFKGLEINLDIFKKFFANFLHQVGVRDINKFYLACN